MGRTREDMLGRDNPRWREELHNQTCLECGEKFDCERMRKFCSRECGYANKRKRVVFNCDYCGKESWRREHEYGRNEHHYCSYRCSQKAHGEMYQGENHWITGTRFSLEHRKKIGDSCRGEKNYRWKGGVKSENERIRNSMEYKDWRVSVFERDNYTCQNCLSRNGNGRKVNLEAHHWLPFHMYISGRFETNNGHTLCVDCHNDFHSFCGVDYSPILEYV